MASFVNDSNCKLMNTQCVNSSPVFKRHEFIRSGTEVALPCLIILIIATIVGTFGNILILLSVISRKNLRKVEGIFIVNLASSDLYVTAVADPMSILAKIEGEEFFDRIPGLCQAVASLCTISCVASLMTIAAMSFNRYVFICAHDRYERIFTKWNCVCICISFYVIGGILVLLNAADIGDHGFDRKSLECIWDRMATFPYTVVFSITLVWIPSIVTGFCYLKIYLYVRKHKKRIREQNHTGNSRPFLRSFHLARTLFIIYAVFITCWAPYALLIVIDFKDTFSHEIHLYITVFAHLHPSLNWLIYLVTNKKFADAYKHLFNKCRVCHFNIVETASSLVSQNHAMQFSKSKPPYQIHNQDLDIDDESKLHRISFLSSNKLDMQQDENSNFENKRKPMIVLESAC
ncbi:melatonin receptor type 1B-A-like [Mercenaria mercenaria]|uniref:melatonin receptor type 1B-A-like n=1 Tax=Mercenaria mercenaria TaxID=6596 RepID=UPI001E1DC75A|nr:melatonin receptor type 1B-A-like [Mercenaria mercenaria]